MKIVIYGTSRSGKDYQINQFVKYLTNNGVKALHIAGSKKLNELSLEYFGQDFKYISELNKHLMRREFIKLVDKYDKSYQVVFVDGHYSFPVEDSFKVVFTEADKSCYDHFFYLDTETNKIIQNFRNSEEEKKDELIQSDDVDRWKKFEITALKSICESLEKELIILDEDVKYCSEFMFSWIKEFKIKYDYIRITKNLVQRIISNAPNRNSSSAYVIDCDKTYSINDTTYDFCRFLDIEPLKLKRIFHGDRYSSYQFFKFNKLFSQFDSSEINLAADYAKEQSNISSNVRALVFSDNNFVIALTAGLTEIWEAQIKSSSSTSYLFGNSTTSISTYYVTPLFKKFFVEHLQSYGYEVISLGDSIIDLPMLEAADQGFIIAHSKINNAVLEYFQTNNTNVSQIFGEQHIYPIKQSRNIRNAIYSTK